MKDVPRLVKFLLFLYFVAMKAVLGPIETLCQGNPKAVHVSL